MPRRGQPVCLKPNLGSRKGSLSNKSQKKKKKRMSCGRTRFPRGWLERVRETDNQPVPVSSWNQSSACWGRAVRHGDDGKPPVSAEDTHDGPECPARPRGEGTRRYVRSSTARQSRTWARPQRPARGDGSEMLWPHEVYVWPRE